MERTGDALGTLIAATLFLVPLALGGCGSRALNGPGDAGRGGQDGSASDTGDINDADAGVNDASDINDADVGDINDASDINDADVGDSIDADAGVNDAAGIDGQSGPVPFACGTETCNSAESYCFNFQPGPGQATSEYCQALPSGCTDGAHCSCICPLENPTIGYPPICHLVVFYPASECRCLERNGAVTVSCAGE
jgi:hypothetical protein